MRDPKAMNTAEKWKIAWGLSRFRNGFYSMFYFKFNQTKYILHEADGEPLGTPPLRFCHTQQSDAQEGNPNATEEKKR
uniref:Uncharacterized protein n=1 Tax=Rhizophora mucronata TaxID=61149 RepID=A0A2P2P9D0_RHIMU